MKRFSMLASAACVLLALVFTVNLTHAQDAKKAKPEDLVGKTAPDMEMQTLDGKSVKLSDMKGKVVVADFWATWCPPCRKSLPKLNEMANDEAMKADGLVVWGVNAREDKAKVEAFMKDNKYSFTVPMDDGTAMGAYHVSGIPTTVVIGRDGTVKAAFVGYGPNSEEQIKEAVKKAMEEAASDEA